MTEKRRWTFSNIKTLSLGIGLSQLIGVLATPLITRVYPPEAIGVLGLYISVTGLLALLGTGQYHAAIPLAEDESEGRLLRVLSLSGVCAVAILAAAGLLISSKLQDSFVIDARVSKATFCCLITAGIVFQGVLVILQMTAVRAAAFQPLGVARMWQAATTVVVQILGGVAGLGQIGVIFGDLCGRASFSGTLARKLKKCGVSVFEGGLILQSAQRVAAKYWKFPAWSLPSVGCNQAALALPRVIFYSQYGPAVAGWFYLADRVIGIPMTTLGQGIGKVFYSEASRVVREERSNLRPFVLNVLATTARYAVLPVILLALGAYWITGPLFGESWAPAGHMIAALCPGFFMRLVVNPVIGILEVVGRQQILFIWNCSMLILVVLASVLPAALGASYVTTAGILSLAQATARLAFIVIILLVIKD